MKPHKHKPEVSQKFESLLYENQITKKAASVLVNTGEKELHVAIKTGKIPFAWFIIIDLSIEIRKLEGVISNQQKLIDKIAISARDVVDFASKKKSLNAMMRKDPKARLR